MPQLPQPGIASRTRTPIRGRRYRISYSYHVDASYTAFLSLAMLSGRQVEGGSELDRDGESGLVSGVRLEDDRVIKGDLFVDCSGFRSLLLGETMGVPFEDWSEWLPCDRALAVPSERTDPLLPITRSTAKPAGWQWRIPLQHRIGNGHVYSSSHMSDDEAERILVEGLDGKAIAGVNRLKFKAGRRKKSWEGNVVAIGLSAGFLEPLESTSIHLIQHGIQKLVSLFPSRGFNDVDGPNTTAMVNSYDRCATYHSSLQGDGARRAILETVSEMPVPDSLQWKMDLFREHGRLFRYNEELFEIPSWAAVLIGQGIFPKADDPLVSAMPDVQVLAAMAELRAAYEAAAGSLPSASEFIERTIGA